jgi:hypothetical protein
MKMSSLDEELKNLQKPIPNGVDLEWLTSGCTYSQSDTVNPNAQAGDLMSQLIFNRVVTKRASCQLMPEERAVGQTVIAHIQAGYHGEDLDNALMGVFGRETFQRHASFINDVKNIAATQPNLPGAINPTVGVNVASPKGTANDREALKRHATNMSSSALEAYRSNKTIKEGVSIDKSEMNVDLVKASKDKNVDLSEGVIDQIKLAAQSILAADDDVGLTAQQDQESEDLFAGEDVSMLKHTQETEILASGSEDLDLAFSNGPIELQDSFGLESENAIMACDEDLADIAGVPPTRLLNDNGIFNDGDPDGCPKIGEMEEVELDDTYKKANELEIGMSDDFEIEI